MSYRRSDLPLAEENGWQSSLCETGEPPARAQQLPGQRHLDLDIPEDVRYPHASVKDN